MSANISVQGSQANGQTTADQPLATGLTDNGGVSRLALGDSYGAQVIVGKTATGAASTSNPVVVGIKAGSNVQDLLGNVAGQVFVNTEGQKKTYSIGGLITPAATPTDVATLAWASGVVRFLKVRVSVAATAAGIGDILILKRSTANSGGTATTPTPVPHDSADGAASSVVSQYSANPTLGTSLGAIRASKIGIDAANGMATVEFDFTANNDKAPVLRSANQAIAINLNGDALLTGEVIAYYIEWSEEA